MASDADMLEGFLRPLHIDSNIVQRLAHELHSTFEHLSATSEDQFLPTPIAESILRPVSGISGGRHLAIDIGGSNLRVGFVELLGTGAGSGDGEALQLDGTADDSQQRGPPLRRQLEKSWGIGEILKNENAQALFEWIGQCIALVVREGCDKLHMPRDADIPLGVTFSFPMIQHSLSDATLLPMGKGFAITSKLDLGSHLINGYEKARSADLPRIKIGAIANDAVATLVSFIYQFRAGPNQKAAMGLICGTGSNATIPLRLNNLRTDKRPRSVSVLPGQEGWDVKIAVNTEWSINGSAPPLDKLGLRSRWDVVLDQEGEAPGFQPLEYMTAGRYLGELARLILLDYMTSTQGLTADSLPANLRRKFGLTTTFLSRFNPAMKESLTEQLEEMFPAGTGRAPFRWTEHLAWVLYRIAKAIEERAAGIIAASVIGLLACAEEISLSGTAGGVVQRRDLVVGYTGGCIAHFQTYLDDCQRFLDDVMKLEFGEGSPIRIVLSPCHDGGITGAGILVAAASASRPV